jgi:flagellar biogenesis protein FliO
MNYYSDLIPTALKMLSALALVLAGLGVAIFFTKRMLTNRIGGNGEKLIRILASSYLGVKKSISLVRIPGALLVLGISSDNIRLLTKIEDRKILDKFKGFDTQNPGPSFAQQLQKFSLRFQKGGHGK